jgi:hypothetical protein
MTWPFVRNIQMSRQALFLLTETNKFRGSSSINVKNGAKSLQQNAEVILYRNVHNKYLLYCDVYGVSYATTSKVHVTSDVSVVTQRLRILKQPNCWVPQQHLHGEWNPGTKCLLSRAQIPYFRGSRIKAGKIKREHREKREDKHKEERTEKREHTEKTDHRREIKGATRDADQRRSKDKSRGTRTAPRYVRTL